MHEKTRLSFLSNSPQGLLSWSLQRLLVLALGVISASGCASYSARPLDSRQDAASVIEQREVEGLFLAVKDLSNPRDSFKYFDRDLRAHGFLPVLLLLELDRQAQDIFDLRREEVILCLRDGTRLQSVDPDEVADAVEFTHLRSVLGFFLILPGFFVASSVNDANDEIEADYQQKSIKSIRMNPNLRSFRAVVFFKIPPEIQDDLTMDEAFIEARVHRQGQGGRPGKSLEFPVHFSN